MFMALSRTLSSSNARGRGISSSFDQFHALERMFYNSDKDGTNAVENQLKSL
jgi:hypothetical protein